MTMWKIKRFMPVVALDVGIFACAFNCISPAIGIHNIWITVVALLSFSVASPC